jgi:hypothetical protein
MHSHTADTSRFSEASSRKSSSLKSERSSTRSASASETEILHNLSTVFDDDVGDNCLHDKFDHFSFDSGPSTLRGKAERDKRIIDEESSENSDRINLSTLLVTTEGTTSVLTAPPSAVKTPATPALKERTRIIINAAREKEERLKATSHRFVHPMRQPCCFCFRRTLRQVLQGRCRKSWVSAMPDSLLNCDLISVLLSVASIFFFFFGYFGMRHAASIYTYTIKDRDRREMSPAEWRVQVHGFSFFLSPLSTSGTCDCL